jgi:outer membrane protein assembly factor BamB
MLAGLVAGALSLHADEWPQWRGPDSDGVAGVGRAPVRWTAKKGIRWRVEIEGSGISSPVIAGRRGYVTTSLTSLERSSERKWTDYGIGLLAAFAIPSVVWRRLMLTRRCPPPVGTMASIAHGIDTSLCFVSAAALLVVGVALALGPLVIDFVLHTVRDLAVTTARAVGRDQTNLWFLDWDEANRYNTWMISTAASLSALALIPFLSPARSWLRPAAACVLTAGVVAAALNVPWAAAYADRYPIGPLVVFYVPVLVLGLWHGVHFFLASGARTSTSAPRVHRAFWWAIAAALALLATGVFVSANHLYERKMVTRRVICFDMPSGTRLWHTDLFSTPSSTHAAANSDATPTPAVAGNVVVAAFGPGIGATTLDGDVLWTKVFPEWIENSIYGAGSSPVTDGEAVFVTIDREYAADVPSRVIAFALHTGEEIFNRAQPLAHDGYATPAVYDDGYRRLLLALTSRALVGYDLATGSIVWRMKLPIGQPVPSPVVDGSRIFLTGGVGSVGQTAAYRLLPHEPPETLWISDDKADVASPVLYKGRLYTVSSTGVMLSFDATTGGQLWKTRLGTGAGAFYASLVAADDKIYAVRSDGTTYVVAAEDRFRLVARSELPEETFASPAIGEGCLLLRTVAALYCIAPSEA